METLRRAASQQKKTEIEYLSFGDKNLKKRVVHPHGIVVKDGVTYVPCFDENRGHICSFRLDRINSVDLSNESFDLQPGFSVEQHAKDGLVKPQEENEIEVLLEAKGATARYLSESLDSRQWHWQKRGVLAVKLTTSRPQSIIRWALSKGPDLQIISPKTVRVQAQELLAEIADLYA